MTLSLDTAYRSFGGEVEASSTPTICRPPDSRRHQFWAIAPDQSSDVAFRHHVALDYLDALAWLQGREISRRRFHLGIGNRLGKADHQRGRQTTRNAGDPRAPLVLSHLLDEVALWKAGKIGVFRTAGPVCTMTEPAGEHVGIAPSSYDIR